MSISFFCKPPGRVTQPGCKPKAVSEGTANISEAFNMLLALEAVFEEYVIDFNKTKPDKIRKQAALVQQNLQNNGLIIHFQSLGIYPVDVISNDSLLTFCGTSVLITLNKPVYNEIQILTAIWNLNCQGYRPVLYMSEQLFEQVPFKLYRQMRNLGCDFHQCWLSGFGYYGKKVQRYAQMLAEYDMAQYQTLNVSDPQKQEAVSTMVNSVFEIGMQLPAKKCNFPALLYNWKPGLCAPRAIYFF
ncbi:MAG: hypothetical protein KGS48_06105 [Bacteroidetes bacterium]|nr:hypothetical protein [Bacteroidota bacterium]